MTHYGSFPSFNITMATVHSFDKSHLLFPSLHLPNVSYCVWNKIPTLNCGLEGCTGPNPYHSRQLEVSTAFLTRLPCKNCCLPTCSQKSSNSYQKAPALAVTSAFNILYPVHKFLALVFRCQFIFHLLQDLF